MLQQLLGERFRLAVHAGKSEVSGFGMEVGKGGSKLHSVAPDSVAQGQPAGQPSQNFVYPGHVQGWGLNVEGIANLFTVVLHSPVVDRSGLAGDLDVDLKYAPDNGATSDLPSFFTAVEEQLGLRLKPEKITVDTLVIDHADDGPTAN